MELFLSLFVVTGIWIWIVAGIFFFIILALSENRKNFWAAISVAILATIFYHSGLLILTSPWTVIQYLVVYFAIGTVWSIIKWYLFVNKRAKHFAKLKLLYINKNNAGTMVNKLSLKVKDAIPKDMQEDFKKYIIEKFVDSFGIEKFGYKKLSPGNLNFERISIAEVIIPRVANYKEEITTWILWWPTSVFWTIANDALIKVVNIIYERLKDVYASVASLAFANKGL